MIGELQCVVMDCSNVVELARFYQALLGGAVNRPDPRWAVGDDFATLHTESGLVLAFQRVADYRAPQWPAGRAVRVSLTEEGQRLAGRLTEEIGELIQPMTDRLSRPDGKRLAGLLAKLLG